MIPDETLALAVKAGDRHAAEVLFRRYQERLFSYVARMLGNPHLAEEAVQEAFIRALRKIGRFKPKGGSFKSWLYTIARNEALRMVKKEGRFRSDEGRSNDDGIVPLAEMPDPSQQPGDRLIEAETNRRLEIAISRLPAAEREVVLLRMAEGLTFKEISRITGAPLNTSLGRMRNAQKRLKAMLEDDVEPSMK